MDAVQVAHRRLRNQHLSGPRLLDPVAVVRWLGAMQAQEYAMAKWSIAQRTTGADEATVQRLVDDGAIVRTHALRPTWHFIASADIGWVQAATGPRVHVLNGTHYRRHGLDEEAFAKSNKIITTVLRGHNQLTRVELGQALSASGIEASGNRLAYLIMRAELDGLVASGAMRGRQHTYALIEERVRQPLALAPDEALAELTRRYFTSHGPATVKDFSWWSSLTVTQARRGLDLVGSALAHKRLGAHTFWFAPGAAPRREASPAAHVLQAYDEYVIAYSESRPVSNLAGLALASPSANTLIHPIVLDSQWVGFWRRLVRPDTIVVRPTMATELTTAQWRAVEHAFGRYADFAAAPVVIEAPAPPPV